MGNVPAAAQALTSVSDASVISAKDDRIVELRHAYSMAVFDSEKLRSSLSSAHAQNEALQREMAVAHSKLQHASPACVDAGTSTSPTLQDIHETSALKSACGGEMCTVVHDD